MGLPSLSSDHRKYDPSDRFVRGCHRTFLNRGVSSDCMERHYPRGPLFCKPSLSSCTAPEALLIEVISAATRPKGNRNPGQ